MLALLFTLMGAVAAGPLRTETIMPHPAIVNDIARSLHARGDSSHRIDMGRFDTGFKNAVLWTTKNEVKKNVSTPADKPATDTKGKTSNQAGPAQVAASLAVNIICEDCYIAGAAQVTMDISGTKQFEDSIEAFGTAAKDQLGIIWDKIQDWGNEIASEVKNETKSWAPWNEAYDFEMPELDIDVDDFKLTTVDLPDVSLGFEFTEDFEIYLKLKTQLEGKASYTLPLYMSKTAVGIQSTQYLLGVAATVDLILDVRAAVDLSGGAHIRLDKGTGFDIKLFGDELSSMNLPGGHFEFLPVSIQAEDVVLHGVLAIKLKAGIELDKQKFPDVTISGGIITNVYANVFDFKTIIKPAHDDDTCHLGVQNEFTIGVGGGAGATIAATIGGVTHPYGPTAGTLIPVFKATKTDCVAGTPTLAPSKRADLVPTTTVTTITVNAQACKTEGMVNCPASMLEAVQVTSVMTLSTAIPSGSTADWATTGTVVAKSAFGTNAASIAGQSGAPTEYTPKATDFGSKVTDKVDDIVSDVNDKVDNLFHNNSFAKRIGLGLAFGLGIPLIAFVIATIVLAVKLNKAKKPNGNLRRRGGKGVSYTPLEETRSHVAALPL